jgi:shikimate kinase
MNIILFGFKSCGKTYFGKLLSKRLSRPFIDTDHLLEAEYALLKHEKLSCREIYLKLGEEGFRALETQVLASLQNVQHAVIAVGGGMILHRTNLEILKKMGKLIYLSLDRETLKKRLLSSTLPAYLDPLDPEGSFDQMYEKRKTFYERIRAIHIDVSEKTDLSVLDAIIAALEQEP